MNHFPVFEPTAARIAEIQAAASEAANPLEAHYDAAHEVRAKGAAFYAFSADEEARAKEMEALKQAREETGAARKEAGAVDVRPGEGEGMAGKEDGRSRAMEKRKRDIEERRRLVEAKRRKVKGGGDEKNSGQLKSEDAKAVDPFAVVEAEAQKSKPKSRWDQTSKHTAPANAADDFLAGLENDLIGKGK